MPKKLYRILTLNHNVPAVTTILMVVTAVLLVKHTVLRTNEFSDLDTTS